MKNKNITLPNNLNLAKKLLNKIIFYKELIRIIENNFTI